VLELVVETAPRAWYKGVDLTIWGAAMTDQQVYERALAEIQRCQQRIDELRAFVRMYEEFADSAVTTRAGQSKHGRTTGGRKASGEMQDWERMVDAVIQRVGKPMRVREIYDAIVPMGFNLESKDPVNALTTKLARSPHFTRPGRGLYMVGEKSAAQGGSSLATRQAASTDDESDDGGLTSRQEKGQAAGELPHSWEQAAKGA
jgi:hypothetical protein